MTLDVSTLSDRTRALRLDPWLWTGATELLAQGGRFFVLAATLAACLRGLSKPVAATVAAVSTVAAALVIDLGQSAMGAQPVGGAVLLSQVAGAWVGAISVVALARRNWFAA